MHFKILEQDVQYVQDAQLQWFHKKIKRLNCSKIYFLKFQRLTKNIHNTLITFLVVLLRSKRFV